MVNRICWSRKMTRDNFHPDTVLLELERGGLIGGDEAKRLLEVACRVMIKLIQNQREMVAHAEVIAKIGGEDYG